jgi:uncharacterized protein YndB with AHSA1/START domain
MEPLVSTIELARPPAEVFTFTTDPHRFAEWQHDVVSVRMLGQSRFATTRRIGGWAAQGIDGPIRAHATITVEPVDDATQSRVTFTLDFEGHGLGVPLVPLVRRQARKGAPNSYRNLKSLLENER